MSSLRHRLARVEGEQRQRVATLVRRPDYPQSAATADLIHVLVISGAELAERGLIVETATRVAWDRWLTAAAPERCQVGVGWLKAAQELRQRWAQEGHDA